MSAKLTEVSMDELANICRAARDQYRQDVARLSPGLSAFARMREGFEQQAARAAYLEDVFANRTEVIVQDADSILVRSEA